MRATQARSFHRLEPAFARETSGILHAARGRAMINASITSLDENTAIRPMTGHCNAQAQSPQGEDRRWGPACPILRVHKAMILSSHRHHRCPSHDSQCRAGALAVGAVGISRANRLVLFGVSVGCLLSVRSRPRPAPEQSRRLLPPAQPQSNPLSSSPSLIWLLIEHTALRKPNRWRWPPSSQTSAARYQHHIYAKKTADAPNAHVWDK